MLKDTIVILILSVFLFICWIMDFILTKIVDKQKINLKILGKGFLRFIIVLVIAIVLCFIIELIPIIFNKFSIDIPTNLITPIQIVSIVFTLYKSYITSIFQKLKQLLTKKE